MTLTVSLRSEIPEKYKWDLAPIYSDDAAWQADYATMPALLAEFRACSGRLGESAATLRHALALHEKINRRADRLWVYAARHRDEDTSDSRYAALFDRAQRLVTDVESAGAFLKPEIMSLPEGTLDRFMVKEPKLRLFAHYFDDMLRHRPHVLSQAEETLLAQVGDLAGAPRHIYNTFVNAELAFGTITDETGSEVELTGARYQRFIRSADRRVRREAFTKFFAGYEEYRNTVAATFAANVKKNVFMARARRHPSALAAALHPANIPVRVYTNLIETVREHLPLLHRYMALSKRVMDLDELHMYDLNAPMLPEGAEKLEYDEAVQLVLAALAPLGKEYVADAMDGLLLKRWVDVYETPNKRGGAHSGGSYDTYPYIMLNYQPILLGAFSLAHELGHAMHSYYTNGAQPYIYAYYSDFVAEVASILNEALLSHYMLEYATDPAARMAVLNTQLNNFRFSLFRQTMLAEFELLAHQAVEAGEALTADYLSDLYYRLNQEYHGPRVVLDEAIAIEWAYLPHFYHNFYVYQYATGISAATALAQQIIVEGAPAAERYRRFLSRGSSAYSLDLLRDAGVDVSTPAPVAQALGVFEQRLKRLERMLSRVRIPELTSR